MVIENSPEFDGGFGALMCREIGFAARVRRIEGPKESKKGAAWYGKRFSGTRPHMRDASVREGEKNTPMSKAEDDELQRKHLHVVVYQ